jgi:hypothetical protein
MRGRWRNARRSLLERARTGYRKPLQIMPWDELRSAESRSLLPCLLHLVRRTPDNKAGHMGVRMNLSQTQDQRLLPFYEGVRKQVDLASRSGFQYGLAGKDVRQYAELLREQMDRRRFPYNPIAWLVAPPLRTSRAKLMPMIFSALHARLQQGPATTCRCQYPVRSTDLLRFIRQPGFPRLT